MSDLVIPHHTIASQHRAADPRASAWVSANAGAGKTKVLTDRVLRLLLAGSLPGRILCLTFTKAAAANMSIKIFERLGQWVAMDDKTLAAQLEELEGRKPSRADLRNARRLFARAIETPGGLKIETLHAFCERLLHLVPFEANVPARFNVLDENLAAELTERMVSSTLSDIIGGLAPQLTEAWTIVSELASGDGLRTVLQAAMRDRTLASEDGLLKMEQNLAVALKVDSLKTAQDLRQSILNTGIPRDRLSEIASTLLASSKATDRDRASDIQTFLTSLDNTAQAFESYHAIFFTLAGTPRSDRAFVTQSIDEYTRQELFDERDRLAGLSDNLKATEAFERTVALYRLAHHIRHRIEVEKTRCGALDFDDLVHKTLDVLSRSDAAWVLYKLDRGIDHVLVDEAQDTNPEQWQILRLITEDFTSGIGIEKQRDRTLFAVGDPKQSIYGFQGAAPHEFEASRVHWSRHVADAGMRFEDVRLTLSFRSVRAVLSAVDATFAVGENFKGLSFEAGASGTIHESARPHAPGQVILWPVEEPQEAEEPEAWVIPLDQPEETSPPVIIARRIARTVERWIERGDEDGRIWNAGDILVLVRKRGAAFEAVIRALKERGIPVAGQDRIDIGAHIAVQDLIAAGRAALLPEDDLTLATALKSPLVGLTEEELFRLAADRQELESLAAAINRHAENGDKAAVEAQINLAAWREVARDFGPFGFFATLLGHMEGRARLVARLGMEAGDAIDAFLTFAKNAESSETPSLLTFLNRFETASHSIKRDFESNRNEVRVMTVHGAKGLEAPVTILIDGGDVLGRDPALIPVSFKNTNVPVWTTKKMDCEITGIARSNLRSKGIEEHNRLLYVAMTRAKDKLLVAPFKTSSRNTIQPEAWSEMIRTGLERVPQNIKTQQEDFGTVTIWYEGDSRTQLPLQPPSVKEEALEPPYWLKTPVQPEPEPLPPLRPSNVLGAAEPPVIYPDPRKSSGSKTSGNRLKGAKARLKGTLTHALLERLPNIPEADRLTRATNYIAQQVPSWPETERSKLINDVLILLGTDELKPLFGATARAEVPITGTLLTSAGPLPVSGQVDRFVVLENQVLIADFKSSFRPPEHSQPVPQEYVAQLALYADLLTELYPQHTIKTFVIWTNGPVVREVSHDECAKALHDIKNSNTFDFSF
ncbi:double-strand break repair helicase AddA [Microvirga sp. W0021]|uniref:DNA 3'-5' helicase n=1 Tax=Hohaiivirga grylli TaxID=3133970 RepID=A0ABV0BHR0_9HYPH